MHRTLVMLASLAVMVAPGGAGSGIVLAGSAGANSGGPWPVLAPLERLLIAVLDVGASSPVAALPADGVLVAHLHLADPAATVVLVRSGQGATSVGPFGIAVTPGPASAPAAAVRIDTAEGQASIVALPIVPAGHLAVVEVLGGPAGIVAQRVGDLLPIVDELRLPTWQLPDRGTNAVALDGEWWMLAPDVVAPDTTLAATAARDLRRRLARTPVSGLRRLIDASVGDVTGDGIPDLALSFRRPFRRTLLNASTPRRDWVDARGQSAHVGLFRPDDLSSIWVAGTLVRPVRRLAACTGALAVAYSTLARPEVVAATVWAWQGFGFLPMPELPGPGRPTCIDIDRDGRPDAAITERS